jgi:hypothetical protein
LYIDINFFCDSFVFIKTNNGGNNDK